jgi:hypothetical protein
MRKEPGDRYPDLSVMRADLLKTIDRADSASETIAIDTRRPVSAGPQTPTGPQTPDRRAHARRRAAQIEAHLNAARGAFAAGRFEDAISASDQAAVLDPDDNRAHDLIAQAREAIQKQQARVLLEQAREAVKRGALTDAANLLAQTLTAIPADSQAIALQREIRSLQRDRELLAERKRLVQRALEHARSSLKERALDSAIRSANEVLAQDPDNEEAGEIKDEALEILAEERQKADHDRRAREVVSAARSAFDAGRRDSAIADLESFEPPHELVDGLMADLRREAAAIQAREREEARRAAEAKAAEEARRAAAAKAAEEARQVAAAKAAEEARQAAAAKAAEEARRAAEAKAAAEARRAAEAKAAEEARRAAEAKAAEETRRAAEAKAAAEARRAAEARAAEEARERARLAAEAADEEARRERPLEETMLDPRGTWHRGTRPPVHAAPSPAADALPELPRPAPRREIPIEREVPRRPLTKYIAIATALAAVAVVAIVFLSRPDSTPAPGPSTTTTSELPAAPPSAPPASTGPRLPVTINAVPWASVRILGKDSAVAADGITPLVVELAEGDYTLELRNDLFTTVTRPLVVRAGAPAVVNVTLPGADLEKILNDVLGPAQ